MRCLSRLVLVCTIALAILVPLIDTYMCVDEVVAPTTMIASTAGTNDQNQAPQPNHNDGDQFCIHGHCHHWVAFTKLSERLTVLANLTDADLVLGVYDTPDSAPPVELLRPPRA